MPNKLDSDLQRELLGFVRSCEESKEPRPLKSHLAEELLRQIARGEREITALATRGSSGDVFICFSYTSHDGRCGHA